MEAHHIANSVPSANRPCSPSGLLADGMRSAGHSPTNGSDEDDGDDEDDEDYRPSEEEEEEEDLSSSEEEVAEEEEEGCEEVVNANGIETNYVEPEPEPVHGREQQAPSERPHGHSSGANLQEGKQHIEPAL